MPVALGLYWVLCKATPGQEMVPALTFSGLSGAMAALAVIVANVGFGGGRELSHTLNVNADDPIQPLCCLKVTRFFQHLTLKWFRSSVQRFQVFVFLIGSAFSAATPS